jgi:hypothetical protein
LRVFWLHCSERVTLLDNVTLSVLSNKRKLIPVGGDYQALAG